MIHRFAFAGLALALAATAAVAQGGDPVRGRQVAVEKCGGCHAVGLSDQGAMPTAPALRALHKMYAVEGLGEAFAEGIGVGDPVMPAHVLEPQQIDDLITYLKTLEPGEDPMISAGRQLARRHCGECHALSDEDLSRLPDAPPFRDLPRRFPLDRFTQAYAAGMFQGHPRMPLVELDTDELAALAAYLGAVQAASPATSRPAGPTV